MRLSVAVLASLMLASCGSAGTSEPDSSGVDVVTTVDVGCPVQQVGSTCPVRPLDAAVEVRQVGSASVIESQSTGADGTLRLSLSPGRYVLSVRAAGMLPTQQTERKMVVVDSGAYASATFTFDSGIRAPRML